ncbi:hypothetical protein GTR02_01905 [Kineococcus sp. R8]|uniref:hypothetical protein n=1 Tax=Kineococcus siccus TaxID=2696567 RepID=UPI0014134A21|nr:hypothetical protein [Kineococcus siccus]NAZ80573.1 hypothetical protein [Kineococcus siccus]
MTSRPGSQEVLDDLGDKIVIGLATALRDAREDLGVYRAAHPGWVADATKRGLANWLHDRIIAHCRRELEDVSGLTVAHREPFTDITVGLRYRIRVKKHSKIGLVATYPTRGALAFFEQSATLFSEIGLDEVRLCVGYEWDADMATMGQTVLSLHDGYGEPPIWIIELPAAPPQAGTAPVSTAPPAPVPGLPTVIVSPNIGDNRKENEEE